MKRRGRSVLHRGRERILKRLSVVLRGEGRVRFAYAYGSFLRRRDARDIDVAIYISCLGDPWLISEEIASRLDTALKAGYPIDLHVLNAAAPAFAFEAMSTGRILLERDRDERLNWEAHALSAYQDIKPILDSYDRRYLSA